MKSKRHLKILEIIANNDIETQEELTTHLKQSGIDATQATVSRDIKELRLVKVALDGKNGDRTRYKYSVNSGNAEHEIKLSAKFKAILTETTMKTDFAGNIVVIKTYAGMAQACAAAIDAMSMSNIVGSVAGDDTVLIVMRTAEDAAEFAKKLSVGIK